TSRSIASGSSSTINVRKTGSVFIERKRHGQVDEEPAGIERAHAAMAASAKSRGDAIRDVAQAKAGASIGLLAGGARFSV
ncbi:hypothetical protein, partial [Stenotrophomonas maltophilia]|uniref:hypothetical protein n=1 Tax=Stenotrophomonas maltophilia TaxID=40324 RepID=UPI0013DA46C7